MRCKLPSAISIATLLALSLVAIVGCGGGSPSGNGSSDGSTEVPRFISLGTAPVGGAFYQVGAAISDALNEGSDVGGWRQVTAESTAGTLENLRRLDSNEIQIAMANSSITYFAVRGEEGFKKKHDVKSIMTLFPLIAMFVTKEGSGVKSIADLKGKRVVVGPEGAGFEYFVRPILREHGLTDYGKDFEVVNAGMQTSVGYLQDESVQATFLGGGAKSGAITSAASSMNILLVPYGASERASIADKYPSFSKKSVKGGTYKGQTEEFPSLNVGSAHLLVRSDTGEEIVYRMTKIIYEGREKVAEKHAGGKAINPKNVVVNTGTEFHPGAIRYYQEIGIWPEVGASAATAGETTAKEAETKEG
jgi:TRAP transporter TAXI family solute receptor